MAKKKTEASKTSGDDFDFDDLEDLNDPISFDGEDDVDNDDRNPSRTKVATELAKEAGSGFFEGLIEKSAKNVLPDEYESGYYAASELADYGKDVLDKNKQKVTKSVYRLGKEVKKILPFKVGLLEKFLERNESDFEAQKVASEEEMRSTAIASELSSIFDKQLDVQTQLAARAEATSEVQQKERIVQTKMSSDIMASIDRSISRQEAFAAQITKEYYRKSLELQFKSYFVQADTLKTIKDHYKAFSLQFTNIEKNTSLPEFVKLQNTERLQDLLRDQAVTSVYEQLFTNSKFMQSFKKKTQRYIDEKVSSFTDSVDTFTDMLSNINDAGEGGGGRLVAGVAANMGGSVIGEKIADMIPESIRTKVKENKTIKVAGNYLSMLANSPSTLFSTIRDKLKTKSEELEQDSSGTGAMSKITGGLSDMFDTVTPDRPDLQVKQKDSLTHNQPAIFDNNVHRSITEVIPLYLAKLLAKSTDLNQMYRAVNSKKTKDSKDSDSLLYDFKKRKLDTTENVRSSVEASVFEGKSTLPKSKQNASSILSLAKTAIETDTTSSNEDKKSRLSIMKSKKSEDALTNYLDQAKKKLGTSATYKQLIEDSESNEDLKKIMDTIPGAQTVIQALKASKIQQTQGIDIAIKDFMRKYPLEGVKKLFSMASKIARTEPVNLITDEVAEVLAKAFATYILVTGQDITTKGLLKQVALRYLEEKDLKVPLVKESLTVLLSDIKKIENSDDSLSSSSLAVVIAAMNTSLKTSIDINPKAYQTLAELYPTLVATGNVGIEQIVEGKLSSDYKKDYVSIEELSTLNRASKDDVRQAREVSSVEGLISRIVARSSNMTTVAVDEIRATGGNPFKIAELAIKTAMSAKSKATEALEKSKELLSKKCDELGSYISTNLDNFSNKTLSVTINKLTEYNTAIDAQILALQEELVFKEKQLNEAMSAVNDVSTSERTSSEIRFKLKVYKATTTANIKALKQVKIEITQLTESLKRLSDDNQALPPTERIKLLKVSITATLDKVSQLLKGHQDQIDSISAQSN